MPSTSRASEACLIESMTSTAHMDLPFASKAWMLARRVTVEAKRQANATLSDSLKDADVEFDPSASPSGRAGRMSDKSDEVKDVPTFDVRDVQWRASPIEPAKTSPSPPQRRKAAGSSTSYRNLLVGDTMRSWRPFKTIDTPSIVLSASSCS